MPALRARAMAGAMTSISSRPRCPASPACGFSPQTSDARRGDAATAGAGRDRGCAGSRPALSPVMAPLTSASGRCVVASATRSESGRQQHHRPRSAAALGEVLGVAGEGDAGVVDDALLHRRGDHRVELAVCGSPRAPRRAGPAPSGALRDVEPCRPALAQPAAGAGCGSAGSASQRATPSVAARAAQQGLIGEADDVAVGAAAAQLRRRAARRGRDRCRPARRR